MGNWQGRAVAVTKSFARTRVKARDQTQAGTGTCEDAKQRKRRHVDEWKYRGGNGYYAGAQANGGNNARAIFALLRGKCFGAWCAHRFTRETLNHRR